MTKFNPKIKSFFEKKYKAEVKTQSKEYYYVEVEGGNSVLFLAFKGETIKNLVKLGSPNQSFNGIDFTKFDDEEVVYLFNKGAYNEEDMLRVLNLKAFL